MKKLTLIILLLLNLKVLAQNRYTISFNEADASFSSHNKKAIKILVKKVNKDLKKVQNYVDRCGIKYRVKNYAIKEKNL